MKDRDISFLFSFWQDVYIPGQWADCIGLCLCIRRGQSGITPGYLVLLWGITLCSDIFFLLLRFRRNLGEKGSHCNLNDDCAIVFLPNVLSFLWTSPSYSHPYSLQKSRLFFFFSPSVRLGIWNGECLTNDPASMLAAASAVNFTHTELCLSALVMYEMFEDLGLWVISVSCGVLFRFFFGSN